MNTKNRLELAQSWMTTSFPDWNGELIATVGDASTRRYFRTIIGGVSRILMDAPPANQDCRPFVDIANRFAALDLRVPTIIKADLTLGFVVLEDLGQTHYLDVLASDNADQLYSAALSALLQIQLRADPIAAALPNYDGAFLLRELEIFSEWFLTGQLGVALSESEQKMLARSYQFLSQAILTQPRCWVHRDFHSRNLMVTGDNQPAILDFQDALHGPVCYDPVSLLRDCYIRWPSAQVRRWAGEYHQLLANAAFPGLPDLQDFLDGFDFCGMQRHLKAVGLFARLNLRDNKPGYLQDVPRTLGYIVDVSAKYPELYDLRDLIVRHAGNFRA